MTAAQHAMAEGNYALAAQRLVYARDADPPRPGGPAPADARLLAGPKPPGRRARRARLGARRARPPDRPPLRRAHLRGHGRARARPPRRPSARLSAAPGDRRVGSAGAPAPAARRPRRRAGGVRAGAPHRTDGRGPARPRSLPPAAGRRRRRGLCVRGRRAAGRRVRGGLVALRPRPRAHRPVAATAWRPASALALGDDPEVRDLLARARAAAPSGAARAKRGVARWRPAREALVAALEAAGVELVFGLPGVHNLASWSALRDSPVRLVTVRHEQTAVYAADGYARATGAWVSRSSRPVRARRTRSRRRARRGRRARPMLVIATDIASAIRRPGGIAARCTRPADQPAMFAPVVKATHRARTAEDFPRAVQAATRPRRHARRAGLPRAPNRSARDGGRCGRSPPAGRRPGSTPEGSNRRLPC